MTRSNAPRELTKELSSSVEALSPVHRALFFAGQIRPLEAELVTTTRRAKVWIVYRARGAVIFWDPVDEEFGAGYLAADVAADVAADAAVQNAKLFGELEWAIDAVASEAARGV